MYNCAINCTTILDHFEKEVHRTHFQINFSFPKSTKLHPKITLSSFSSIDALKFMCNEPLWGHQSFRCG